MIPALTSSFTYVHPATSLEPNPNMPPDAEDEEPLSTLPIAPPPTLPPFPLTSTVDATPAAVQALSAKFEACKTASGKPVAIVSGGSLSGYATPLVLVKQGFNVLVVEKRAAYSRQNIVNLKQDAVFSLARLAPDGGVAGDMPTVDGIVRTIRNNERQTVTEIRIEPDGAARRRQPQKHHRFMEWMAPSDGLPARLPQLKRPVGGVSAYLDAQEPSSTERNIAQHERDATISAPYLDLAFPDDQFIGAMSLEDWQLGSPERMRTDTLVLTSLMDLEKSLNDYCAAQPGIDILHAEVHLEENGAADDRFIPVLKIGEESIRPNFPVDLICIAEGAHSVNRNIIGGAPAAVDPNESWHQSVYVQPTTGEYRPGNFDVIDARHDPFRITVVDYVEQRHQSVALVSVCTPADAKLDEAAMRAEQACAQAHIVARRATPFQVSEATRQFASSEINVKLMRAKIAGKWNAVIVGDAAAFGSPAGATGASFALSAYPEAIERLVTHPQFGGSNGMIPKDLLAKYNREISFIADIAHGRQSALMRAIGAYSPDTGKALAQQIAKARFGKL